jgi:hypothetical protein
LSPGISGRLNCPQAEEESKGEKGTGCDQIEVRVLVLQVFVWGSEMNLGCFVPGWVVQAEAEFECLLPQRSNLKNPLTYHK